MIVITGATGNVGSKLTELLLAAGKPVRLIARTAEKLQHFADKGAEILPGSLTDEAFLTNAFEGAEVVFAMMPGDYHSSDIRAYQTTLGKTMFNAIKNSGVKRVVNLSSVGGHTTVDTGVVAGLAEQEERLASLTDVHILHLRPAYFMENTLGSIGMIKHMNINGSAIRPDVALPMIATKDIAAAAFEEITNLSFTGHSVRALLGPRDYTQVEVTATLGAAIGKPELPYIQFPYDQAKAGIIQAMGVSDSMADALIGLSHGANTGVMNTEIRNERTTTPTTFEEFAHTFAYVYNM